MGLLDGDEKTDVSVLQIIERKRKKIPTFSLIHASFVSFKKLFLRFILIHTSFYFITLIGKK